MTGRGATGEFLIGSGPHRDVTFVTDPDRDVTGTKSYDPWGVVRTVTGEEPKFGFQGDATDEETGLVDMGGEVLPAEPRPLHHRRHVRGRLIDPLTQNLYIYDAPTPGTSAVVRAVSCG